MRQLLQRNNFWVNQFPALFWTALLFTLSSLSNLRGPSLDLGFEDKIYHFTMYTIYGIFLARAFYRQQRFPALKQHFLLAAFLAGVLFGLSDEFHQSFTPGRSVEWGDWLADALGIVFSLYLVTRVKFFKSILQGNSPEVD